MRNAVCLTAYLLVCDKAWRLEIIKHVSHSSNGQCDGLNVYPKANLDPQIHKWMVCGGGAYGR